MMSRKESKTKKSWGTQSNSTIVGGNHYTVGGILYRSVHTVNNIKGHLYLTSVIRC